MGNNMQNSPQGNYGPTQPAQPPTQYGNTPYPPPPPYYNPNPYPPLKPNRKLPPVMYMVIAVLLLIIGVLAGILFTRQTGSSSTLTPTATAAIATPTSATTPTANPTQAPTSVVISPATPTSVATQTSSGGYCGLGTWASTSVSPNQTVQGPAVINGVYSVNGHNFAEGGTNKVGYIAVLEDSGTYTVNSSGTACQPIAGTPSQSDFQTVINAMVQDQRVNGCSGGCSISRIQKFSNGNPDGGSTNQ